MEAVCLRKKAAVAPYGNGEPYPHLRAWRCANIDPRVDALLGACGSDLFAGKVVLDLGCGGGFISLLAASFGAARVKGVDIDLTRIEQAAKLVRYLKRRGKTTLFSKAADKQPVGATYPSSVIQSRGSIGYGFKPLQSCGAFSWVVPPARDDFPHNVEFICGNVLFCDLEERHSDVVLCLRLTKWIQTHWGDDGLLALFWRCWRCLLPGGVLVLEAQEYKAGINTKLHPREFPKLLVNNMGFVPLVQVPCQGFLRRPLSLYRKPLSMETPLLTSCSDSGK